jgi:hypothetical protein
MKLKLKNTPEQVELIKAMGSRDATVAREATQAFAAFIGPVVSKVLTQAGTASAVYSDLAFDEDDNPSIPLDLFAGEGEGYTTVWSQNVGGGLPTSEVSGFSELKVATYRLDSAVSFLKRYARRGRLDVVSKAVERMTNEVLVKQERNAWAVVLKALAEARTKFDGVTATDHIESVSGGSLTLGGLNSLITLVKRINTSYAAGTTDSSYGLTDLFVSPEIKGDIRAFAYNPVGGAFLSTTVPSEANREKITDLPAGVREEIYRGAGTQEIYGIAIHELVELGVDKKYNTLFEDLTAGTPTFDASTAEILVGLDLTKDAFVRPVARNSETGGTFTALADDQFVMRADKIGFYGALEEGRVCIDGRAVAGLIVAA